MNHCGTMNAATPSKVLRTARCVERTLLTVVTLLVFVSCAHKGPPPVYHIGSTIPAGSRLEYYAQIDDGSWQVTQKVKAIPRPMAVKEAEKWAISAAQQRLGKQWKDYSIRVLPPDKHSPVVVWRRNPTLQF